MIQTPDGTLLHSYNKNKNAVHVDENEKEYVIFWWI